MERNDKEIDPSTAAPAEQPDDDAAQDDTPAERPSAKEAAQSPEQQAAAETRRQKRAERAQRFDAQIREANEAAAAARAEAEAARREAAEIRGRIAEREAAAGPRKDPREDQITQLEADAKALLRQAATHMEKNPAEAERLIDEHNRKLRAAASLATRIDIDREANERSRNAPQPLPMAVQHDIMRVSAEYPFLRDNRSAQVMFSGLVESMTASGKMPDGYTTYKAAAAQVAKVLGIGGQSAPSERSRNAYNGAPAGEADGGSDSEHEPFDPTVDRHKNALAQALANRRGTGLAGKEARLAWEKEVGKRVRRAE